MKQNKKNSERPRKLKFNAYAVSKKELKITRLSVMPFVLQSRQRLAMCLDDPPMPQPTSRTRFGFDVSSKPAHSSDFSIMSI